MEYKSDYSRFIELINNGSIDPDEWPLSMDDLAEAIRDEEVFIESVANLIWALLGRIKELEDVVTAVHHATAGQT